MNLIERRRGMQASGKQKVFYDVDVSKIQISLHLNNTFPYCYDYDRRDCYPLFDLFLSGGKTYTIHSESQDNVSFMVGAQFVTESALEKVGNGQTFSNDTERYDSGWLSMGDVTVTPPAYLGDSPIACVRFTFRKSDNSRVDISPQLFITKLTITEV